VSKSLAYPIIDVIALYNIVHNKTQVTIIKIFPLNM